MSSGMTSPDGQWMWTGTEWIPAPPPPIVVPQSQPTGFNFVQPMEVMTPIQVRRKSGSKHFKILISILAVSSVLLFAIIISIVAQEEEQEFSLEYTRATAYIYIESIQVDNGEANRMFEVDVFYDERNRYEYRTGDECDALEYYDSPRTYYLEEICVINYADPFVDEVTFGACAEYVASDQSYDISPNNVYGTGCVKWQATVLNPTSSPSFGLEDDCTYEGEMIDDNLRLAKYVSISGFDDGDSNQYNAEIDFTLSFVLTFECTI